MQALAHVLLSAIAVFAAARILPGVHVANFATAVVVAVVLGLVNATLRPVMLLLTLPINIITLGLLTFVIIGAMVLLVSAIVPGFQVDGFFWSLAFAGVLAVFNAFLQSLR